MRLFNCRHAWCCCTQSTNSVVKMRAAAYSSMYGTAASGDPLMLTATYDPSNTAEVIVVRAQHACSYGIGGSNTSSAC